MGLSNVTRRARSHTFEFEFEFRFSFRELSGANKEGAVVVVVSVVDG